MNLAFTVSSPSLTEVAAMGVEESQVAGWIASNHRLWAHIVRDDTTSSDHGARADASARQDSAVCAKTRTTLDDRARDDVQILL